ncbi:PsiF family protein, partial [Enterovirga sp.]|uniref:PsiF family protein n=1 Tax=Enterovirga sp. TaxID=2026350 RepID=UPI002612D4F1
TRTPLPPAAQAVPRGQRTFARCNAEAVKRRLRGAERRHFVQRCRLGYGLRLFRRGRGPAAGAATH